MDTDMLDTHMPELMDTHMPELTPTELTHMLMDTESRLVKLLENYHIHSSYQQSFTQNLW